MGYEFYEDDEDHFPSNKYVFGNHLDSKEVAASKKRYQSINYKYLQIEETDYHFSQSCFDNKDIIAYFNFVKLLSEHTFDDLLEMKQKEWHLNKSEYKGNLKKAVLESVAKGKHFKIEEIPDFYHFALYTSTKMADRNKKIKSPRIYFFVGDNAMIYPLFYDPFHEINP